MNYMINLGSWGSVFAVPSDVVDKYIKIASGSSIKVLLYFLRHCGEQLSGAFNECGRRKGRTFILGTGRTSVAESGYICAETGCACSKAASKRTCYVSCIGRRNGFIGRYGTTG